MEQTNTTATSTPAAAPAPTPAPAQTPPPVQIPNIIVVPAKGEDKWFESRQLQAAFITGAVSFVVNMLNILISKIR